MKTTVSTEEIQKQQFTLAFDDSDQPVIEFQGREYSSLTDLVAATPLLSDAKFLPQYTHIANFLLTGIGFMVIDDPVAFRRRYEKNAGKLTPEYGVYDISSIREPYIENGKLIFFAENNASGVPYKVTSPFPMDGSECSYDLLPRL